MPGEKRTIELQLKRCQEEHAKCAQEHQVQLKRVQEEHAKYAQENQQETRDEGCQAVDLEPSTEERHEHKEQKAQTCVFFKRGICKFGPYGKNAEGSCKFQHPTTCPSFELFGWKGRWGCKKKNCRLMHRICCKKIMNCGTCDLGKDKCLYFHPKDLEKSNRITGWKRERGSGWGKGRGQGLNVEHLILSLFNKLWDGGGARPENGQEQNSTCSQVRKGVEKPTRK